MRSKGGLCRLEPHLFLCHRLREIAQIGTELLALQFIAARDRHVQKRAVVRDDQKPRARRGDPILEPLQALQIEVIGRFVQQVKIGWLEQQPRQQRPPRLTAGQRVTVQRPAQPQAVEDFLGLDFQLVAERDAVGFLGSAERLEMRGARVAEVDLRDLELTLQVALRFGHHGFAQCAAVQLTALREVRHSAAPRDLARVRHVQTGNDAQQRGFAAAIAPQQCHALPDVQLEVNVFNDDVVAKTLGDAVRLQIHADLQRDAALFKGH